jgi:hypothetical protein
VVVPSVCCTVTVWLAPSLNTDSTLTVRCVEDAGDATTSVVVAVVMLVFVRAGVTVVPERSTNDAWTEIVPADPVTNRTLSEVEVSRITASPRHYDAVPVATDATSAARAGIVARATAAATAAAKTTRAARSTIR